MNRLKKSFSETSKNLLLKDFFNFIGLLKPFLFSFILILTFLLILSFSFRAILILSFRDFPFYISVFLYFTYFRISRLFLPSLAGIGMKPSVSPVFSVIA